MAAPLTTGKTGQCAGNPRENEGGRELLERISPSSPVGRLSTCKVAMRARSTRATPVSLSAEKKPLLAANHLSRVRLYTSAVDPFARGAPWPRRRQSAHFARATDARPALRVP